MTVPKMSLQKFRVAVKCRLTLKSYRPAGLRGLTGAKADD